MEEAEDKAACSALTSVVYQDNEWMTIECLLVVSLPYKRTEMVMSVSGWGRLNIMLMQYLGAHW